MEKIEFLLNKISVEWSGVLFYSDNKKISSLYEDNEEEFEITLEDILPLDIGSSSYTEYDLDERVLAFQESIIKEKNLNEIDVFSWRIGHIHSHHSMGTNFSGTDLQELRDNAPLYNYYLSLIVNNALNFTAFLAQHGEVDPRRLTVKNSDGDMSTFTVKSQKDSVIFKHPCKIVYPARGVVESTSFLEAVDEMEKEKKKSQNLMTNNYFSSRNHIKKDHLVRENEYKQLLMEFSEDENLYDLDPAVEEFMVDILLPDNMDKERVETISGLLVFLDLRYSTDTSRKFRVENVIKNINTKYKNFFYENEDVDDDPTFLKNMHLTLCDIADCLDDHSKIVFASELSYYIRAYIDILSENEQMVGCQEINMNEIIRRSNLQKSKHSKGVYSVLR